MSTTKRPLAVVTGASTGIGLELARCAANNGFNLIIASNEPRIETAAAELRQLGVEVEAVQADLATDEGVRRLYQTVDLRDVAALMANAGIGLGGGFLDQDFDRVRRVIDTNLTGTLAIVQSIGRDMRSRGEGKILITGSIAGLMPGTFQAVYSSTKSFLDSFAQALRAELKDSGVTVTCLLPGATETEFFARADMLDTKVGTEKKQPADEVAKAGFEAMMKGTDEVVAGWANKLKAAISHVMPSGMLAEQHRKEAAPGTATEKNASR